MLEKMLAKSRFHHYNFAYPGEQDEGIRRRIRQGTGGPKKIEPGADVHGHYHIPDYEKIGIGDNIFVSDNSGTNGRWEVKLESLSGHKDRNDMIRQDNPNLTGAEFQGVVVKKI